MEPIPAHRDLTAQWGESQENRVLRWRPGEVGWTGVSAPTLPFTSLVVSSWMGLF
jgi:hypothetical protein